MPFEYTERDVKATLILYKQPNGQLKFSGMFRLTFPNGSTSLRLTPSFDNSRVFDDIQIIEPQGGDGNELALINFGPHYNVQIV